MEKVAVIQTASNVAKITANIDRGVEVMASLLFSDIEIGRDHAH